MIDPCKDDIEATCTTKKNRESLPCDWAGTYDDQKNRSELANWLLSGKTGQYRFDEHVEYEGYDGWYNNIARPDSGAIGNRRYN